MQCPTDTVCCAIIFHEIRRDFGDSSKTLREGIIKSIPFRMLIICFYSSFKITWQRKSAASNKVIYFLKL